MYYKKKHLAGFTVDTPHALYMPLSQDGVGPVQRFIEVIRESAWSTIEFEDDCLHHLMPCGATGGKHAGFLTCRIWLPVIT